MGHRSATLLALALALSAASANPVSQHGELKEKEDQSTNDKVAGIEMTQKEEMATENVPEKLTKDIQKEITDKILKSAMDDKRSEKPVNVEQVENKEQQNSSKVEENPVPKTEKITSDFEDKVVKLVIARPMNENNVSPGETETKKVVVKSEVVSDDSLIKNALVKDEIERVAVKKNVGSIAEQEPQDNAIEGENKDDLNARNELQDNDQLDEGSSLRNLNSKFRGNDITENETSDMSEISTQTPKEAQENEKKESSLDILPSSAEKQPIANPERVSQAITEESNSSLSDSVISSDENENNVVEDEKQMTLEAADVKKSSSNDQEETLRTEPITEVPIDIPTTETVTAEKVVEIGEDMSEETKPAEKSAEKYAVSVDGVGTDSTVDTIDQGKDQVTEVGYSSDVKENEKAAKVISEKEETVNKFRMSPITDDEGISEGKLRQEEKMEITKMENPDSMIDEQGSISVESIDMKSENDLAQGEEDVKTAISPIITSGNKSSEIKSASEATDKSTKEENRSIEMISNVEIRAGTIKMNEDVQDPKSKREESTDSSSKEELKEPAQNSSLARKASNEEVSAQKTGEISEEASKIPQEIEKQKLVKDNQEKPSSKITDSSIRANSESSNEKEMKKETEGDIKIDGKSSEEILSIPESKLQYQNELETKSDDEDSNKIQSGREELQSEPSLDLGQDKDSSVSAETVAEPEPKPEETVEKKPSLEEYMAEKAESALKAMVQKSSKPIKHKTVMKEILKSKLESGEDEVKEEALSKDKDNKETVTEKSQNKIEKVASVVSKKSDESKESPETSDDPKDSPSQPKVDTLFGLNDITKVADIAKQDLIYESKRGVNIMDNKLTMTIA